IVSAALPFPDVHPHGYLINIMVQGGASGSPVFLLDTGNVIGAIYASRLDNCLPTNFSHVVPSHLILRVLTDENKAMLLQSLTNDVPALDEILASIPQKPVQQVTFGIYRKSQ